MTPVIDILLAAHNGADFLVDQIDSIRSQSYQDWRLTISDDCSTDRTLEIAQRFSSIDERITVISREQPSGGASAHFLRLLQTSVNEYFAFADQDDVWLPHRLADAFALISTLEASFGKECPIAVYSDLLVVDNQLRKLSDSYLRYSGKAKDLDSVAGLLTTNIVAGCTITGNAALRSLVLSESAYLEKMVMHDWGLALLAASCGRLARLSRATVLYRQHGNNVVGAEKRTFRTKLRNYRSKSVEDYWRSCSQARALLESHGDKMDNSVREIVKTHAFERNGSVIGTILDMRRCGLIKPSVPRMLGQVLTVALFRQEARR